LDFYGVRVKKCGGGSAIEAVAVEKADQANSNAQVFRGSFLSWGRGDVRAQNYLGVQWGQTKWLIWTALSQNFQMNRHPTIHHPLSHQSSGGIRCQSSFDLWAWDGGLGEKMGSAGRRGGVFYLLKIRTAKV
jgi:hypothetical protein